MGGGTRQDQVRAFFRRVDHVVGGNRVDADRHRGQIDRDVMRNRHRVSCGALTLNGYRHLACVQRADVGGRDRCRPGSVGQNRRRIGFTIDGHRQRGAGFQPITGAANNQVLTMLDAVNHIVARHGIDPQTRQVGINGDVAAAGASIAVTVSDACRHGQIAVANGL